MEHRLSLATSHVISLQSRVDNLEVVIRNKEQELVDFRIKSTELDELRSKEYEMALSITGETLKATQNK